MRKIKDEIKVSVIVPVYNVEPYLRRCLDSLVNQTLKDIEIICVNDCSPDNSLDILKKYAAKDSRIKIIDLKKNQGVSVARNSGMKIAKGEYIGFCDPDDYVDLDFYEKLYKTAKYENADIAKAARKKLEIGTNMEFTESLNEKIREHKCYFSWQFTTAIYRNKMLKKHGVKFPVGVIVTQDVCFLIHAVIASKSLYLLDNTFYHYERRESSGNSKIFSDKKAYSYLHSSSLILHLLNKASQEDKHYHNMHIRYFQLMFQSLLSRNSEKPVLKRLARFAIKYYKKQNFSKKLNLPKLIILALKNKDEKTLISLLEEWQKNDFYPEINISKSILQNRKLYIWGIGRDVNGIKKTCELNNWKIAGFLDSNKDIKKIDGYKVQRPELILNKSKKDFFIIISSRKYRKEIAGVCRKAGLKRAMDFWMPS